MRKGGVMYSTSPIECWNSQKWGYENVTSELWLDHDSCSHFSLTWWIRLQGLLKWHDQKTVDLLIRHLICFKTKASSNGQQDLGSNTDPEEQIWEYNSSCFEHPETCLHPENRLGWTLFASNVDAANITRSVPSKELVKQAYRRVKHNELYWSQLILRIRPSSVPAPLIAYTFS